MEILIDLLGLINISQKLKGMKLITLMKDVETLKLKPMVYLMNIEDSIMKAVYLVFIVGQQKITILH